MKGGFLGKKGVLGEEECSWVGRGSLGRGSLGREGVLGSKGVHRKGGGSWMRRIFKGKTRVFYWKIYHS